MAFSRRALTARGFARNRNVPGFVGHCATCRLYRPLDWWTSPPDEHGLRGDVVVCSYCGVMDARDARFVQGFSVGVPKDSTPAPVLQGITPTQEPSVPCGATIRRP